MSKDWTGNSKAAIAGIAPSNHSLKNRESDDFYATDPKAVDMLCNLEKFSQTILEPACGQGHIAKALEAHGYNIKRNGVSNYTVMKHTRIIFLDKIPDNTDDIKTTRDIPSWKRMCFCILKNDHTCRFMGFGLTREQQTIVSALNKKYYKVGEINEL